MKTPLTITNFLTPPSTEVSKFLAADNQLVVCNGVNPAYKLGELRKDLGYYVEAQVLSGSYGVKVTGLHDFRQSSSIQKELALATSTDGFSCYLFYRDTGTLFNQLSTEFTYDTINPSSNGYKLSAESFLGYAWLVGYDVTANKFLPLGTVTGTTFSAGTPVSGMPRAKFIRRYRDRLYVANAYWNDYYFRDNCETTIGSTDLTVGTGTTGTGSDETYVGLAISGTGIPAGTTVADIVSQTHITMSNQATATNTGLTITFGANSPQYFPYRIFYSSVPTSGMVTWSKFVDFLDVDFSEEITGLGVGFDTLVAFTAYNAYTYDQTAWKQQNWPGCSSHFSIQSAENYLIYANNDGIWVTTGGRPTCVSTGVTQLIRNSDPEKWSSAIVNRTYSLYLGNTSANGIDYQNLVLNYDMSNGMFWWRELRGYDNASLVLCSVKRSGEDYLVFSDSSNPATLGNFYRKSSYGDPSSGATAIRHADSGSPIYSQFRTKAFDMGDPTVKKAIASLTFYSETGSGLKMYFRTMDDNQKELTDWAELGSLDRIIKRFEKSLTGYFIEFKGESYDTSPYFRFQGLSVLLAKATSHD
jgi:hypothetical protein